MPRYWVVRTDSTRLADVIVPSLDAGLLRQGWGYRDNQDLGVIGPLVRDRGRSALDEHQKATWRRVQRFWPGHWDPVEEGDRLLLPKVPDRGLWRLVEVAGGYRYERHLDSGDHGHILPIRTLVLEIANTNRAVGAGLQRTMRTQGPMWNIDRLAAEVQRLLADPETVFTDADELALIAWVDAVTLGREAVPEDVAARAREAMGHPELVELTLVTAATLMLNRYCSALGLPTRPATLARLAQEGLA